MEDRLTPSLYLELGNLDPARYEQERAPELLACEAVERVSWWENLVPRRSELPMAIEDGMLLGVAEAGRAFTAPEEPPGFTAHHFHHYARPSQGILTGRPTTGLLVVWISPKSPALELQFRDWADFVHIRHIAAAAIEGFTQITVYENDAPADPQFMHFYELDSPDPEGVFTTMARQVSERIGGGRTEAFRAWADYDSAGGRLVYCNTFRLLGASCPS